MDKLNLPCWNFRIKSKKNKRYIFDGLRKKFVTLTREEWVRQHFIRYLIEVKKYPVSLIAVERQITLNQFKKRIDIVVFSSEGLPFIVVECKAPSVKITQGVFDQIAIYNTKLNASFLVVTNGLKHYCYRVDAKNQNYSFLKDFPNYTQTYTK
ncbi:MAG: type I restriction enzyme HsdR N-terminal domain-containing protein [Tenacibaculum sp.]